MYRNGRTACWLSCLATLLLISRANSAQAQFGSADRTSQLQLPTQPASWINSPPLTTELLKGKAAVFYLYEEG